MCHLSNDSKKWDVILYASIVFPIAWFSVLLRFAGKWVSSRLYWDDAMVAVAILLTAAPLGCVMHMAVNGFGEHLWNLEDGKLSTILRSCKSLSIIFLVFANRCARSVYISWTSYVVVLCLIKISLVLFYLEIFQTRKFRITAYIFLVYLVANSLAMFGIALFTCTPIESFWNRDIKTGKCINLQAGAYFISASSLLQDIMLLVLPIMFISNLQMKRHRKVAVAIMFIVGTFGCVATLMRLPSLSTFKISIDPCWDYVPVTIWTIIELGVGFVCISLPSIRVLLVKIFPKSLKNLVSNITTNSQSRSKSNMTPGPQRTYPSQVDEWTNNGSTWVKVTANTDEPPTVQTEKPLPPIRSSFLSAFWRHRDSSQPPAQLSQLRSHSRRLESPLSNYSQVGIAVTAPSFQEEKKVGRFQDMEMLSVSAKANKHMSTSCQSCRGDQGAITALPKIGCIPERSYSGKNFLGTGRGGRGGRGKDMV
jgi:hypothetical protein